MDERLADRLQTEQGGGEEADHEGADGEHGRQRAVDLDGELDQQESKRRREQERLHQGEHDHVGDLASVAGIVNTYIIDGRTDGRMD